MSSGDYLCRDLEPSAKPRSVGSNIVLSTFTRYVLTCRKNNQREWMIGLVEEINKISIALGEPEKVYKFNGDRIIKVSG